MKIEITMVNGDKFYFRGKDAKRVKQEIYISDGNNFGLTDDIKMEDGSSCIFSIKNISSLVTFKEEK